MVNVFLVPPFQKPDEIVHFKRAAVLATKNGNKIPARYVRLIDEVKANKIAFNKDVKFNWKSLWFEDKNKDFVGSSDVGSFNGFNLLSNYIGYLPSIIGIKIADFFSYPIWGVWLGRLFGLVLFLISIFVSLKLLKNKWKYLVMGYAFLPMVIQQTTSVGYDVMPLILSPIIFTLFIQILEDKENNIFKIILLIDFLVLLQISKMGYYGFSLLLVVVIFKIFREKLKKRKWIYLMSAMIILAVGFFGFYKFIDFFKSYPLYGTVKYDIGFYLDILWNSILNKRSFYIQTGLGYFGWLDYQYDFFNYLIVSLMIFLFFNKSLKKTKYFLTNIPELVVLLAFPLINLIIIMTIFYFINTRPGSIAIDGVQGRYLLPLVLFIFLGVVELILHIGKKRFFFWFTGILLITVAWNTIKITYQRYYDFSGNFSNPNELIENYKNGKGLNEQYLPFGSKNTLTKVFGTSYGDEIGGFEFIRFKPNDSKIDLPYKYLLMDGECQKIYRRGYLNADNLEKSEDYKEIIKNSIKSKGESYCLKIFPIVALDKGYYFDYVVDNYEDVLVRLLFVKREQEYR